MKLLHLPSSAPSRARATSLEVLWLVGLLATLGPACATDAAAPGDEHGEHDEHDEHDEHGEHGEPPRSVRLTPEALSRSGIVVGSVARAPIGGGTSVPAELEADPAHTAHVSALVASRITRVEVQVGDRVAAGQRLAVLASTDVGSSRAALAEARVRRDAARVARDRQAQLVEAGIGARRGLVEAEAALAAVEAEMRGLSGSLQVIGRGGGASVDVTAPVSGVVVARHASLGEVAEPGAPLFTITDPSRLWVVGHVPELDLELAREGSLGTLTLAALPGRRWSGHIDFVAPALDPATRTLRVRFVIDGADAASLAGLRAGLFGRLALASHDALPTALVVPRTSLARLDGEDVVFVPDEGEATSFHPLPVRLGRRDGDLVELLEGLDEGAPLVTSGAFTLRSELSRGELASHEH